MIKDFKPATDGTVTMSATVKIQFVHTMLCREAIREFDILVGQVRITTNGNLNLIKESLLRYFLPINALNKPKRAMQKPRYLLFKISDV